MKVDMKMWSLFLLVGLAVTFAAATAPGQSCMGRCREPFRRGRLCECDPSCTRYKTCCKDYQTHCGQVRKRSDSASEEWVAASNSGPSYDQVTEAKLGLGSCPQFSGPRGQGSSNSNPSTDSSSGPALPAVSDVIDGISSKIAEGLSSLLPLIKPSSSGKAMESMGPSPSVPERAAPSLGSSGPVGPYGPAHSELPPGLYGRITGFNAPPGSRPNTLQDLGALLGAGSPQGPAAGLPLNSNLCSDSPIDGVTALSNGTILVFKGKLFWSVDPQSRSVGPPQNITDILGIPSPIDALFTRCDCQGKTYIFKGDQYWRLDSDMKVEPGFPQSVSSGFSGLKGPISAALSQPETRTKPETIYFFKNGNILQTFSFPSESNPSCSNKSPKSPSKNTGEHLGGEINLRIAVKGFPLPITAALSFPNPEKSDSYDPYVLSGNLFFSIKISGDLPSLVNPESFAVQGSGPQLQGSGPQPQSNQPGQIEPKKPYPMNSIQAWLQC